MKTVFAIPVEFSEVDLQPGAEMVGRVYETLNRQASSQHAETVIPPIVLAVGGIFLFTGKPRYFRPILRLVLLYFGHIPPARSRDETLMAYRAGSVETT